MPEPKIVAGGSLHNLLRALLVWCVCALLFLIPAAAFLRVNPVGENVMGYLSSGISFAAALAAGIAAAGKSTSGKLAVGLRLALALVIPLLTAGFLIAGKELSPSGILSAASFTLAGCLAGSVLFAGRREGNPGSAQGRGVRMKSLHKTR